MRELKGALTGYAGGMWRKDLSNKNQKYDLKESEKGSPRYAAKPLKGDLLYMIH
ncbi:hypothetical protein [Lysinibacillus sphaericus]|uniref:hypothetical protein n=1 Tax=Lysinibacillus sphaericus TaxID=1421 RepID=UPI0018CD9533|nr:hypothetical protein [Lysinibacillus sphaericus]